MNNAAQMLVTGTKSALTKLAACVGREVQTNARTGTLFVAVDCLNPDLSLTADARSNGSVAYRLTSGENKTACTHAEFLAKCAGYVPHVHNNIQRHVAIIGGVICRLPGGLL